MLNDLRGVIPPISTPFDAQGNVVHAALAEVVEFQIAAGVHGLIPGGSTGEGHTFERDDFARMFETVAETNRGRLPLLAGLIVNSTQEAITRGRIARDLGAQGLQVTPVHYLFKPDEEATLAHFRAVAEGTDLPILIYNVIPWNYLSPALLLRIMREVPGVVGVKQSSGDLKLLADLVLQARPQDLIFTAIDALLYPSYALGARGTISALPAASPHANVALWDAVQRGDHATAKALHERLLVLWNALSAENLPANVKYALACQGVASGLSRAPMPMPDAGRQAAIRAGLEGLGVALRKAA